MRKVPKYQQVRDTMLSDIRSGRLGVGDKLPTREELAKRHGVTLTTVEKALGDLTARGVLRSVKRLGTFVENPEPPIRLLVVSQQVPVEAAAEGRNDTHGLLWALMRGADGVSVEFMDSSAVGKSWSPSPDFDVVAWLLPSDAQMELSRQWGSRTLVVNRYPPDMNFVSTDHRSAMREVTDRLIRQRPASAQLVYLSPRDDSFIIRERLLGFVDACAAYERFYRLVPVPWGHELCFRALSELPLDPARELVMVAPSMNYTGAVLRLLGGSPSWALNRNFFYADFDNDFSLERVGVAIPTVVQDYIAMGAEVVKAAKELVATGSSRRFVPYLLRNLP